MAKTQDDDKPQIQMISLDDARRLLTPSDKNRDFSDKQVELLKSGMSSGFETIDGAHRREAERRSSLPWWRRLFRLY